MNIPSLCDEALGFHQKGQLARAERLYLQVLELEPANFTARHLLGIIRAQQGRNAEALALIGAALQINPAAPEALSNYGNVLKELGRPEKALASYDKAIALNPYSAETLNNRANILRDMKRHAEALESYDQAVALKPDSAEAWYNRGSVLRDMQHFEEALASYDRALALRPDFPEALINRGKVLCVLNRVEEGLASFTRAARLLHGTRALRGDRSSAPHKARHDREQQDYLAGDGAGAFHLTDGARLATPAVNPDNQLAAIAGQWRTAKPQIVVIDDLLTPEALDQLRKFCWGSTVWQRVYDEGYLGAFPENGFACPLLAQIADELRSTFPAIFGAHPLHYLWGFKYDSTLCGINVHADEAAVNVNFWITPDEANLDPQSGGLVVWDKAAPLDWDFAKYNGDFAGIRDFLARSGARETVIPYRANRAVIFDSDLFHQTDKIAFKEGYLNRRINVTLLYGRRETTASQ